MSIRNKILACAFVLVSSSAWCDVFVHWTSSALPPPAAELGVNDIVLSWNDGFSVQANAIRKQGYRVYVEVSLDRAAAAADAANGLAGVILIVHSTESAALQKSLPKLRSAHRDLRFVVLDPDGKRPEMRGSLVIKRNSVLEVSSPTAQPWIDSNLSLVKIEQLFNPQQVPSYTFSWGSSSGQQEPALTADDYSLAVAEAGAFHADLVLELDDHLEENLSKRDPQARTLWNRVRTYAEFYSHVPKRAMKTAANVAIVVDDLDPSDEVMNLLARHNIPFKVLHPGDLASAGLKTFDVVVVFAKPDKAATERIRELANSGMTCVLVDAHGAYNWQDGHPVRLNEHAVSYSAGKGKVLELSEPVTDPETFAQDIRRLLGTQNALISLWNGLTTIAVPYNEHGGGVTELELINYSADPLRLQVQVKGSYDSIRYETPQRPCCESLVPVKHNGSTEFVIPELRIAGRVHLDAKPGPDARPSR